MRVMTFYSYKGGVGRTLACANFGLYLAKMGQKVVLADMDFEAPGLDAKFTGINPLEIESGILDQFAAFQSGRPVPTLPHIPVVLPEDVTKSGGSLHVIPAGAYASPNYYSMLSQLKWEQFTGTEEGMRFCLELTQRVKREFEADILIIDSRTGLTETGGLCTQVFPDTVLLFTCTSRESLAGIRRAYERIRKSPIVAKRHGERNEIDVRIIMTRMPRPDDLMAFDLNMKERLQLRQDRLYYLFEEDSLSLDEYLAVDRFGEERPQILDDYVELFANLHPEAALPYITRRLDAFRVGITRRSPAESERLIQELLMLFPLAEVFLEAAHYYRIARDGDGKSVQNYIRYFQTKQDDSRSLREFAELVSSTSVALLRPRDKILQILRRLDPSEMGAAVLTRFLDIAEGKSDWLHIVEAIESRGRGLDSDVLRRAYLIALHRLREWAKIAQVSCLYPPLNDTCLLVGEALANVGDSTGVRKTLEHFETGDLGDLYKILRIFYRVLPDVDAEEVRRMFPLIDWTMVKYVSLNPSDDEEDKAFVSWARKRCEELSDKPW